MATLTKESSVSIKERDPEVSRPARRPAPAPEEKQRSGLLGRFQTLLQDIIAEIGKVTWPSISETRNLTIVVIGISVIIGGLLGLVDLLLVGLLRLLSNGGAGF